MLGRRVGEKGYSKPTQRWTRFCYQLNETSLALSTQTFTATRKITLVGSTKVLKSQNWLIGSFPSRSTGQYTYIYIYRERERERERGQPGQTDRDKDKENEKKETVCECFTWVCVSVWERVREKER